MGTRATSGTSQQRVSVSLAPLASSGGISSHHPPSHQDGSNEELELPSILESGLQRSKALVRENAELKKEIEVLKLGRRNREYDVDRLEQKVESLKQEVESLKQEVECLKQEVGCPKQEAERLKRENTELRRQAEKLRAIQDILRPMPKDSENLDDELLEVDGDPIEDHDSSPTGQSNRRKRRKVDSSPLLGSLTHFPEPTPSSAIAVTSSRISNPSPLAASSSSMDSMWATLDPSFLSTASTLRVQTQASSTSIPKHLAEDAIAVKGCILGDTSKFFNVSPRIQATVDEYVEECSWNGIDFHASKQCLASTASRVSSEWWPYKELGTVACRNCVRRGHPCIREVNGRFVVLPLPPELMEWRCEPGDDGYYVIWDADDRKDLRSLM